MRTTLALSTLLTLISARDLFAHYLVTGLTAPHATTDITTAQSLNITAFALDILNPSASWSTSAIATLFSTAQSHGFSLFFSLDTAAVSDITQFDPLLKQYLGHPAYHKGPNGNPFVSTFNDGGLGVSGWGSFRSKYGGKLFFVPNFDNIANYYTDPSGTLSPYFSDEIIDGAFNWETAWPPAQDHAANVSATSDTPVQSTVETHNGYFMAPLSSLQFKDQSTYGHYYRAGAVVLPQRMEELLALKTAPDAVEVLTWNDAGESHYIGSIWSEVQPPAYASLDHTGWQALIRSFGRAYKSGATSSAQMTTSGGKAAEGALWYHTFTDPSACQSKPDGWQAALPALNWGVVAAQEGLKAVLSSGGQTLETVELSKGLNYGSVPGVKAGAQTLSVVDGSGKAVASAKGGKGIAAACGAEEYNFAVVGLK